MENYIMLKASELSLRMMIREEIRRALSESGLLKALRIHEELLDVDQASDFLKLKKSTLYSLTSKDLVPYRKKRGKLYFYKAELVEYLESGSKRSSLQQNDFSSLPKDQR